MSIIVKVNVLCHMLYQHQYSSVTLLYIVLYKRVKKAGGFITYALVSRFKSKGPYITLYPSLYRLMYSVTCCISSNILMSPRGIWFCIIG